MVTHIVLFTLKKELTEKEKQQAIAEITDALAKLPENIEQIQSYEVFSNESPRQGSDIGLISTFLNEEDLNIYRNHPKHLEAVNIIAKYKEISTFIDYSVPASSYKK